MPLSIVTVSGPLASSLGVGERSKRWVNEISDQGNDEQAPHGAVPYS